MTEQEAKAYGNRLRKRAREEVSSRELPSWHDTDEAGSWYLANRSYTLGIVAANGSIDTSGAVARAFLDSWRKC